MRHTNALIWLWLALTLVLVTACAGLSMWSPAFARDVELIERPTLSLALALTLLGFVYLLTIPLIKRSLMAADGDAAARTPQHAQILWIILLGGLAMRLALFNSTPIFEDDYYRYLWDGAVTANGYNPFTVSPDDAQGEPYHYSLQALAHQSGIVIERVNHSELTTVYPPVAQAAFALAYLIEPWSLAAWRAVCLAAELATLLLLIALLDRTGRSRLWVALYWLSPLAAKEFVNSAHMDVIVMPFVLGAALLSLQHRYLSAVIALGFAVGAKFWPLMLAPLILRPLFSTPRRLALGVAILALMSAVALTPLLAQLPSDNSGLTTYALHWRNNSAHYVLIEKAFASILKPLGFDTRIPGEAVRLLLASLAAMIAVRSARQPIENGRDLLSHLGLVTAAIVLLSPSQFPWYALWFLPFAVFTPWSGLLLMMALMPIYYAGFHFLARDAFSLYREGLVFALWLPVWALLGYEAWRVLKQRKPPLIDAASGARHA